MIILSPNVRIPLSEFSFQYARSSGPGGQNVNKVNTKAILRWPIFESKFLPYPILNRFLAKYPNRLTVEGVVVISSSRYRDQKRNKQDCLERLEQMLLSVAKPPKKRKATKPSRGSKERRLGSKKRVSDKKKQRQKVSWE